MRVRRKLTAPLRDLEGELDRLLRIDAENQEKYSPGPGRPASGKLSDRQLHILTEGLFFTGYRHFEQFTRDVFLLYCLEKTPIGGPRVRSYLDPISFTHAEDLLKSSMPYLDWTSPDKLLKRAETYLEEGYPIKQALAPRLERLRELKALRNHIAHGSPESTAKYVAVLRRHYGVVPLRIPRAGEFLLQTDRKHPNRYKLLVYMELIRSAARAMVQA